MFQVNYTDLASLYESVGHIQNQLTNLRKAMQTLVFDTPKGVVASLKKLQYFNFEKEELGQLPPTVSPDAGKPEDVEVDFQRVSLIYFLISLTQNRQEMSLYYLGLTDLKYDIFDEFTSKKDLSFYTILLLLTHGDYDQIKSILEQKNVKNVIFYTEEGRNIVNSILKNDFKQMRKITLDIFSYLQYDAILSENLHSISKQVLTAFTQILLKNYTRLRISTVADFMIFEKEKCLKFLENEIANRRLNFKIDSDNECVIKNQEMDLSYLHVFKRATEIIKKQNSRIQKTVLDQIIESDKSGISIGGVFQDFIGRNH